ncbi:MAG: helix-turn-helix domain-containing protein [Campylobacterales bacterium]|nr:helix-turn-helix domain-containing protein [Campylobacterales bacterium]
MLEFTMEKIDGRKLPEHEQLALRELALRLMDEGVSNKEIAKKLGIHEVTISNWKKKGLTLTPKGRKIGEQKILSKNLEQKIYNSLSDLAPIIVDSFVPFWTKKSILKMIKKKFRKDIPSSTLGDYLKNWNLNSDSVKKFKANFIAEISEDIYNNIKIEAKNSHATIWWLQVIQNSAPIGNKEIANGYFHFIVNNNTGLLMICIYSSPDLIKNFKDFLLKATQESSKLFLLVNGLTENQYDNLYQHIKENHKNNILEFIPLFI